MATTSQEHVRTHQNHAWVRRTYGLSNVGWVITRMNSGGNTKWFQSAVRHRG
jgi:uncharacterized membrane protein YGL010W